MVEVRSVETHRASDFTHGYRESRPDESVPWERMPHSEWTKASPPAYSRGPQALLEEMGVSIDKKRALDFDAICDSNHDSYWYLAVAAENGAGEEALKWIMGAMSAELNARKLPFSALSQVLPARILNEFVIKLNSGEIDRTFAKPIFVELLAVEHWPWMAPCQTCSGHGYVEAEVGASPECMDCWTGGVRRSFDPVREKIAAIIADPRFKPADDSAIDVALDEIIAANPDQFEKARDNPKLIQWFVGQAMKATQGKAKAPVVIEKMQERLRG